MEEEIFALAQMLGHVNEDEKEGLRVLCAAAEEELRSRLKKGVSPQDCRGAFPVAGAWLALAGLMAGRENSVERFTAGELCIQMKDSGNAPARQEALRVQAMQVMAPYLQDGGFAFQGVPG